MSNTGFERFVEMMGGVENLPSKEDDVQPQTTEPVEEYIQAEGYDDDFWTHEQVQAINTRLAEEAATGQSKFITAASRPHVPVAIQPRTAPVAPQPHNLMEDDLKFDDRLGERAPRSIHFVPFGAVVKTFPYQWTNRKYMQQIASAFIDQNKIYSRTWDYYYVWTLVYEKARPVIFVPESQVLTLIDEINTAFPEAKVKIEGWMRDEGFTMDFDYQDELRPQWLGQGRSREQYQYWEANCPIPVPSGTRVPEDRSLEAFKAKIDAAIDVAKSKSKAKKKANHEVALQKRQEFGKQVLRAQRYLGLLPKNDENALLPDLARLSISPLDPAKPAPYPFELDAIFIAFDVEAYERSPKPVTEVGVATLDTRDLKDVAPGELGKDWQKLIRARHFRVIEYKHLVNKDFVDGCPDRFEFGDRWGKSEFVGKDYLASVVNSCFNQPYSKKIDGEPDHSAGDEKRQIILLGHDISQDIAMLQSIGFNVLNRGNLLEAMDTAVMFRHHTRDVNPTGLGKILYHFDLEAWNLHNAGNDAVYTVWAMLAICVKSAMERANEEVEKQHAETAVQRKEEAVEAAKERADMETEGWLAVDDGEDSGVAVTPKQEDFLSNRQKEKVKQGFGPAKPPPQSDTGLWTTGGAALDV